MGAKKLIPLVIVLAVVLGFIVVLKLTEKKYTLEQEVGLKALTPDDYLVADVTRVEVFSPDKAADKVLLVKTADAWTVASRFNAPGDADKIKGFLEKFKGLKGELRPSTAEALGDFLLKDDTALRVRLFTHGEKPAVELLVGKGEYGKAFVRPAGDTQVYQIDKDLRGDLGLWGEAGSAQAPESKEWVGKQFAQVKRADVTGLSLTYPDKRIELSLIEKLKLEAAPKKAEGEAAKPETVWVLRQGGAGGPLNQKGLADMLAALEEGVTASDAVDPAKLADWRLDKPAFNCTVTLTGGKTMTVLAGRPTPGGTGYMMVEGQPTVYEVPAYSFDRVFPAGTRLVDLKTDRFAPTDMTSAVVKFDKVTLAFTPKDGKWVLGSEHFGLKPLPDPGSQLVEKLATWQPADFADFNENPAVYGFDKPWATLDYTWNANPAQPAPEGDEAAPGKDGAPAASKSAVLMIGGEAKTVQGRYAMFKGSKTVFVISRADVTELRPDLMAVFEPTPLTIKTADVVAYDVQGAVEDFKLARKDKQWEVTAAGKTVPAAPAAAQQLVSLLGLIQADEYLPPAESLAKPVTVTVNMADGKQWVFQIDVAASVLRIGGIGLDVKVYPDALKALIPKVADLVPAEAKAPAAKQPEPEKGAPVIEKGVPAVEKAEPEKAVPEKTEPK